MKDAITKASRTSSLLLSDIKDCYQQADATQEIILRQILQNAVELEKRIHDLAVAVGAE